MSKMSLLDKLKIFLEISKSSYWFIIAIILLVAIGIILITTSKRTIKRNKKIYIGFSVFLFVLILIIYHTSLNSVFNYLIDNLFISILFPNFAIYFVAIVSMNIILWISLFHYKTGEIIKKVNVVVYIIMNYLLVLTLSVIDTDKLDVFTDSSLYTNEKATALIELSSLIFIVWIIFLVLYKIILTYIRKDFEPKVKKVIVKKPVKMLPENYEPVPVPDYIQKAAGKRMSVMESKIIEPPQNNVSMEKFSIQQEKELTQEFEKMLTVEDYRLLLKILKEEREKQQREEKQQKVEREQKVVRELEDEKRQLLRQKEVQREKEEREREKQEIIRLEEERKNTLLQEQLRIEALKQQELEREQEKFTELEMLYRSIR